MTGFQCKRIYEPAEPADGYRVLVDRMWPRGLHKVDAAVEQWLPDVAPSAQLRRWFDHDPARWDEFVRLYHVELEASPASIDNLAAWGRERTVTLCFAARDKTYNNAVALKAYLERAG